MRYGYELQNAVRDARGLITNKTLATQYMQYRVARCARETIPPIWRIAESRAGTRRARVLAHIRACGRLGATDAEIQAALGFGPQSVTPRRGELVRCGLVLDSGFTRPTPSGCRASVWLAVEHARAAGV